MPSRTGVPDGYKQRRVLRLSYQTPDAPLQTQKRVSHVHLACSEKELVMVKLERHYSIILVVRIILA